MIKKILIFTKALVTIVLLLQIISGKLSNAFICLLTIFLLFIADLTQRKLKYPNTIQILIYLFIVSTEVLGEVYSLYVKISYFDLIMHALSGYIIASLAIYIVKQYQAKKDKKLLLIFTISLSMAVGALWEVAEFSIDNLCHKDMQKDTIITEITSSLFSKDGTTSITRKVESMKVNNINYIKEYGGYIDIGLHDTMQDIIMCFIGTIIYIFINKIAKLT